jgi:eukaryotic-like serine/threonine-protein kinase
MTDELPPSDALVAGRYRLDSRLGRGGMADVYAAHDTLLDRRVAIKLLRATPDSGTSRARFVSEARILAGLSDPGLVMVLDAGISGDHPYLVMELLPGGTVADLVDRGSQPPDRVAEIGAQVASALVPVHAAGVVHRDIKPGNLLLDSHGRVRLADFGIARLVSDAARVTETGITIGTATYLAPEQASGGEVGTAADVYSLGLVLLELLTGAPAFSGTPTEAALARLVHDPAVPIWLPDSLRTVVAAMTSREPSARPTAAEVAAELLSASRSLAVARAAQAGIDTQAVVVAPPRGGWRRRPDVRAGALFVGAAVVVSGLLIGLTNGGTPAEAGAQRHPASQAQTQARTPSASATATATAEAPADAQVVTVAAPPPRHAAPGSKHRHHSRSHRPHKPRHHKPPKHHKPAKHHGHKHHKPPKHHGH